jgi:hypothetical protein
MPIDIFIAYPPDHDGRVAQLHSPNEEGVDIPAEILQVDDQVLISLFSRSDGLAWQYPADEFLSAVERAVAVVRDD